LEWVESEWPEKDLDSAWNFMSPGPLASTIHGGTSLLALLSAVALAGWGVYHSLRGEPLWKAETE